MRIENDVKLDYKDVLIRPKRSTLGSRSEVDLERKFTFRNYQPGFPENIALQHYRGIPIMAANMDGVGTFEMADTLAKQGIFTCLAKTYSAEDLIAHFSVSPDGVNLTEYVAMSIGTSNADYDKFCKVYLSLGDKLKYLCIDVANGYTETFVNHVRNIRERYPQLVIIAGNVVTGEMTEELILAGADIVKVGIGPGCFTPDTEVLTDKGWNFISNINLGDKVLTHNGTLEEVTHLWNFTHHNQITSVELNDGAVYEMTPDHKVFAVHSSKEKMCKTDDEIINVAEWVSAKDLTDEWFVVTQ